MFPALVLVLAEMASPRESRRAMILPRTSCGLLASAFLLGSLAPAVAEGEVGINDPIHQYWTATPKDRFSLLKAALASGEVQLDTSSELRFLETLLEALEVPVSSQMLVFSVTSLQKNLISPRRPRALYFSDDTYVGYVPGGQIEVISLDPELGGIFYIFDDFRPGRRPQTERSDDCMRCHSPRHMDGVPGLVIESVVPGITGGGEKAFRREITGHGIPLNLRFGGWHVTGAPASLKHWGNLMMIYNDVGRVERPIQPGELFDFRRYPRATSDVLPQLLHEHQIGFVNRALQASYRARVLLKNPEAHAAPDRERELDELAKGLVKYLLFAEEAAIPSEGIAGDADFKAAFASPRKAGPGGASLRDLDLKTRLLAHRCSYMIYSPAFVGLQPELKSRIFGLLGTALSSADVPEEFAYLPAAEREAIRGILKATLPDLPEGWGEAADARLSQR